MTQPHTLKNILLEKLNRILNPNFSYKFIWAIFIAGAGLIGYQRFIQLGGTLEFISDDLTIKLSIPSGVDTFFVIVGGIFILISCFFFYQLVINKDTKDKRFTSLKKAAPSIRTILDENRRIFINFGPNSEAGGIEDVRWDLDVWENSKRNIIIPNNDKILEILKKIQNYSKEERTVVDKMLNHIEAFRIHCENPMFDYSKHQFPISFSDLIYQYCSGTSDDKAINYGNWVKNEATKNSISIEKMHVFGSVLYGGDPTDVDVLVKANVSNIEDIKNQADTWQQISSNFRKEHGIDLHLTVFTALESDGYTRFLSKIPKQLSI